MADLKFDTNAAIDELMDLLAEDLGGYIALCEGLPQLNGVYKSADYSDPRKEKPYINIFPTDSAREDTGQRQVGKRLTLEIAIFVAGPDEALNTEHMISYVDCVESLFADSTETGSLFDITTGPGEYFSRGSTTEKMARVIVECTTRSASR